MVSVPAPHRPWWHWRRFGFNFLTLSIVAHLLLGVGATYWIVQITQIKRKHAFAPGPRSSQAPAHTLEHKIQMQKKQQTMSAPAPVKRITAANRHDVTQLKTLVEALPPVAGKPGHPKRKPEAVLADRAYDSQPHRKWLWERGIIPFLSKRGEAHGSGLGVYRYVVERTFAWFKGFRRLRYERTAFMHEAVLSVAMCMVCFRHL